MQFRGMADMAACALVWPVHVHAPSDLGGSPGLLPSSEEKHLVHLGA